MFSYYQQTLFYVDIVVKIVQAVSSQDSDDDAGHYGHRASEKNSLPFRPLDVKKALQGVVFDDYYAIL